MDSISSNPFASTSLPDDFRDFIDAVNPFEPLTEADIHALCEMEAERNIDILHEVAIRRAERASIPMFPVTLSA